MTAGAATADTQGELVKVAGAELRVYRAAPTLRSATIVLVHGIGTSHRYFARLQAELERVADTVSIDLPGFGGRAKPDVVFAVEDHARVLAAVLDELGLGPVVLVGHSMGGQVVTELARVRPDLVSHLVLIGPVTDARRATAVKQGLALARDTLREPIAGNMIVFADYLRCGPRWFVSQLPSMLGYRTDLALRAVQAPTLVIRGADDPVARMSWCRRLASQARDGEVAEFPGRHLVQFSAPVETALGIVEFVRSRPGIGTEAL
ncbi:pimeloyl-ACP methyl ester carboxylesterase [Glaciihabitans tibetensis]|uniref:Pimeloyl-ACP methyl ester carboxylesterase n=1 Tax=Glaciihabitans tibetensis TaxID=1266600 RepID=A0A2T0V5D1_9MICO|nr:alpha/beta hydrolase [Glaciihabitans tibetensis]PRY65392.1 pimeloyl-ACP methyl ester carboxylesterase [Glaciihabitans tibetensis]